MGKIKRMWAREVSRNGFKDWLFLAFLLLVVIGLVIGGVMKGVEGFFGVLFTAFMILYFILELERRY